MKRDATETGSERRSARPFTGKQFLESIRDSREVWIYGERVKDVTTHPAFRNGLVTEQGSDDEATSGKGPRD